MEPRPDWIDRSPLLQQAFAVAAEAHGRRGTDDTTIAHPVAVAALLCAEGFPDEIVAAALLHDVIEDTTVSLSELATEFGPEVTRLVGEMTENEGIEDYRERKAEHRQRMSQDRLVAAIYAADKLATTRYLDTGDDISDERMDHYRRTLEVLIGSNPNLPFLIYLEEELDRLDG